MTSERILYASCMAAALVTAVVLRRPSGLSWRPRLAVWLGAIAGAGIGAKLPFALAGEGGVFRLESWAGDGKTILAGLAGGYLGVEIAKYLAGVRTKTGDAFAVPLAAAVAVGRWGCFFNGCCGAPVVPIVESAFHAAMALVLWRLERVEAMRHQLLKLYLIAYAAFRFGTEFVRTEPRVLGPLTPYHLGAAALALAMASLWVVDERAKRIAAERRAEAG